MMSFPLPAIQSTEKGMAETLYVTYGDDADVIKVPSESDSEGKYVIPPVEIPDMYNRKDRHGGITVAGARVVFTYAGFKRQQMILVKLQSVPELADQFAVPLGDLSAHSVEA
ncbi:hypothetical protein CCR75_003523 [Bremia lactucae]|uniref:Uncharacterized protein n=1 Tax=Bremia lactucae TaxID=4779 RepID=A0A976IH20_BRELC|nr:hypothetical protein CCR75_003523 [Bremia lactucae]